MSSATDTNGSAPGVNFKPKDVDTSSSNAIETPTPFYDAYSSPDPELYIQVGTERGYSPRIPAMPEYCSTLLDCAALFGSTSLACMYGWDFARSCEFWKADKALTDEQREKTLINKRYKIIGLDFAPLALEYSKRMNIIDQGVVQDFRHQMSDDTRAALQEADVVVLQQCTGNISTDDFRLWINTFASDRTRPKRLIYDVIPDYEARDISAEAMCGDMANVKHTSEHHMYRRKTDVEYAKNPRNGWQMELVHYTVDFLPINADKPASS